MYSREEKLAQVKKEVRNIPNFPKEGVNFKDITTVLKEHTLLNYIIDIYEDDYKSRGITKVVGVESRGFVAGGALARDIGAGFVVARKPGKLPSETHSVPYSLEYGSDALEIHKDALEKDDVVLIHDDLLATGGTMEAAIKLVKKFGVKKIYVSFIIELSFLNGRDKLTDADEVHSLITYDN